MEEEQEILNPVVKIQEVVPEKKETEKEAPPAPFQRNGDDEVKEAPKIEEKEDEKVPTESRNVEASSSNDVVKKEMSTQVGESKDDHRTCHTNGLDQAGPVPNVLVLRTGLTKNSCAQCFETFEQLSKFSQLLMQQGEICNMQLDILNARKKQFGTENASQNSVQTQTQESPKQPESDTHEDTPEGRYEMPTNREEPWEQLDESPPELPIEPPTEQVPPPVKRGRKPIAFPDMKNALDADKYQMYTRITALICALIVGFFYSRIVSEVKFALVKEHVHLRTQYLRCPTTIEWKNEVKKYPSCMPQMCARYASDDILGKDETMLFRELSQDLMRYSGGSTSGFSIFDLDTGTLSANDSFISIYDQPNWTSVFKLPHDIAYKHIRSKIKRAVASNFKIDINHLYRIDSAHIKKLNNSSPLQYHDEYWRPRHDKATYYYATYVAVLFLNTYRKDFYGGRYVFHDDGQRNTSVAIVEPKEARLLFYTTGPENYYHIERVTHGESYTLTMAFGCDRRYAFSDPMFVTPELPRFTMS